ncbi:hypothetical protein RHSIM_Rhsim06G0007200 [Rhododendron simsii]|uniref:Uncharacterized protein n=1 Tax=Rhododendron simsii TaxID=118357 RepID=A0A834GWC3_RHOSS|nr:hypothetical protein RHSIM_Rhsim06G0007200 [Rhododendron simsii]
MSVGSWVLIFHVMGYAVGVKDEVGILPMLICSSSCRDWSHGGQEGGELMMDFGLEAAMLKPGERCITESQRAITVLLLL